MWLLYFVNLIRIIYNAGNFLFFALCIEFFLLLLSYTTTEIDIFIKYNFLNNNSLFFYIQMRSLCIFPWMLPARYNFNVKTYGNEVCQSNGGIYLRALNYESSMSIYKHTSLHTWMINNDRGLNCISIEIFPFARAQIEQGRSGRSNGVPE